jgi:DHA2 family methylenomycin A resistance protein-like MFS transporter
MGSVGVAAGPVLGGALVAAVGWRSIFVVNVPVGLVELWLLRRFVNESPRRSAGAIDWSGLATSTVALAAVTGGFILSGPRGWSSPLTLGLLVVGVLSGFAFVHLERQKGQPMMPLGIFSSKAFPFAVGIGFCFNLCLYGSLLCLSIYLQQVRGESPLTTGLLLLPMASMVAGGSIVSGRITARSGPRLPMLGGLVVAACGAAVLATVGTHAAVALLIVGSLALGLCSLAMPAMSALAVNSVDDKRAGLASGIFNTSRQAGGAVGVAILGSLLVSGGHRPELVLPLSVAAFMLLLAGFLAWKGTDTTRRRPTGRRTPVGHRLAPQ